MGFFKEAFQKRKETIPDEVVKEINIDSPKGFEYVQSNTAGYLILTPTSEAVSRKFLVKFDAKENGLPTNLSDEELMNYVYRTQKRVIGKQITVIDQQGEKRNIMEDPITHEGKDQETPVWIIPAEFPQLSPSVLTVENDEKISVNMQRVPYESMDHILLENKDISGMKMRWVLAENQKSGEPAAKMSVTATSGQADSVDDAIKGLKILKAVLTGSIKIDGYPLKDITISTQISDDSSSEDHIENGQIDEDLQDIQQRLSLWVLLKQLEDKLNVHFDPKLNNSFDEGKLSYTLIQNLLNNHETVIQAPVDYLNIGHLSFMPGQKELFLQDHQDLTDQNLSDQEMIFEEYKAKLVGKSNVSIAFLQYVDCTLLGAKFRLVQSVIMNNISVENIESDKDGVKLHIINGRNSENPWRMITKFAINEEVAQNNLIELGKKHCEN